jgi:hypothetical protein
MDENKKKILEMLAQGKITVDEASNLLTLVNEDLRTKNTDGPAKPTRSNAKYLYVKVEPKEGREKHSAWGDGRRETERVNVRIPISLVRAGMKLTALMPPQVADDINKAIKEKGMGFDIRNLKDEYIEPLIDALGETEIEVDSDDALIKVYAQ